MLLDDLVDAVDQLNTLFRRLQTRVRAFSDMVFLD